MGIPKGEATVEMEVRPLGLDGRQQARVAAPTSPELTGRGLGRIWSTGIILMGIALMTARRVDVVSDPKLWAEDGAVFLVGSFTAGAHSLLTTYAGYLHLIPRTWALLTTLLPIRDLALSYSGFAIVFDVFCCALALSRRLDWLIPSPGFRATAFFALIVLPGTSEIFGTLTNSIWYAGVALILLGLSVQPATRWGRLAEPPTCVALSFTGVTSVIVAPTFFLRWYRNRSGYNLGLAVSVGAIGLCQSWLALTTRHATHSGHPDFGSLPRAVLFRPVATLLLGEDHYRRLAGKPLPSLFVFLVILFLLAFAGCLLLLNGVDRIAVLSIPALSLGLTFIAQGMNLNFPDVAGGRYFVFTLATMVLVILAAASRFGTRSPGRLRVLAAGLTLVAFSGAVADGTLPALPSIHWSATANCIASHRPCRMILNPPGWVVDLPPLPTARH